MSPKKVSTRVRGIGVAVMHQHVDRLAFLRQRETLMHAEAMLLVDDGQREIAERDLVLEQRMGADQEIDVASGEPVQNVGALAAALAAGQDGDAAARPLRRAARSCRDAGAPGSRSAP